MNTTTILKATYPLAQADLARFGIELGRSEDGQPMFVITFLSKKPNVKENYKDFKALFTALFKVPSSVLVHTEDIVKEQAADTKRETTVEIVESTLTGAELEA